MKHLFVKLVQFYNVAITYSFIQNDLHLQIIFFHLGILTPLETVSHNFCSWTSASFITRTDAAVSKHHLAASLLRFVN